MGPGGAQLQAGGAWRRSAARGPGGLLRARLAKLAGEWEGVGPPTAWKTARPASAWRPSLPQCGGTALRAPVWPRGWPGPCQRATASPAHPGGWARLHLGLHGALAWGSRPRRKTHPLREVWQSRTEEWGHDGQREEGPRCGAPTSTHARAHVPGPSRSAARTATETTVLVLVAPSPPARMSVKNEPEPEQLVSRLPGRPPRPSDAPGSGSGCLGGPSRHKPDLGSAGKAAAASRGAPTLRSGFLSGAALAPHWSCRE